MRAAEWAGTEAVTPVTSPTTTEADEEIMVEAGPGDGDDPPAWLRVVAYASAAGVLSFGAVGLLLAINGQYRPALAFPLGAAVFAGVCWIGRPALRAPADVRTTRQAHTVAAIGIAAIAAITCWNAVHASEHVLIDRDGGSYLNTGRWIARNGNLEADVAVGAFRSEPAVGYDSYAVYYMHNGKVEFQFAHLLPAVLAESFAIGGDRALTTTPALLGGVALVAFFVLAWRLMRRPWFALAATLGFALIIPQVSFSRDAYSEIPSEILVFTAAWLLATRRVLPRWRIAFAAGLFLGALQAVRIDATVMYLAVPPMLAVAWAVGDDERRGRDALLAIAAFVGGMVPGLVLGFVDLVHHSGLYWSDLWHHSRRVIPLVGISAVVSAAAAAVWHFTKGSIRRLPWNVIGTVAAVLVAIAGFGMWFVRPHLQTIHGGAQGLVSELQAAEGQPIDPTRRYFEESMRWMWWYLGPLTLVAAILGAAFLVRALLRGRSFRYVATLAFLVPSAVLYLYKASASPDQVWVTRRFLVNAFPMLVILALGFAAALYFITRDGGVGIALRVAAVVVALAAVAWPAYTVFSVRDMSEKRGYLSVLNEACDTMGPHPAVLVVESRQDSPYDDWIPQALRGFCGADVAISRGSAVDPEPVRRMADRWAARSRNFFVVSNSTDTLRAVAPGAEIIETRRVDSSKQIERALTHRPRGYMTTSFAIALARFTPGSS